MNLKEIKKEFETLDLKVQKDFDRYIEVRKQLLTVFEDEIAIGRCEAIQIIRDIEERSFKNYPRTGYEFFDEMYDLPIKDSEIENYNQLQWIYDYLAMMHESYRLFKKERFIYPSDDAKIRIKVYENPSKADILYNYQDVKGYFPRHLNLNITLSTKKHTEDLIDFLKDIKTDLVS